MKEVTAIARGNAASGNINAALVDTLGNAVANEGNLNTLVNSNRDFINAIALIADLNC